MSAVDVGTLGPPISGPTAFGSDRRRLWNLTRTLAVTDFRLKFFGSALGYLWQLLRPLLLFGVLFVVFSQVVDLGEGVDLFASALLLGIVLYGFLNESTSVAVRVLVERENLVRKVEFPRIAIPVATVLTSLMNLGLNLVAVLVFLTIQGARPRWDWLQMPLLIAGLAILCLGLALLLSSLYVWFRDVAPAWDVVLQAAFYGSPIFYPVQIIEGEHADLIKQLLLSNPFAAVVQQSRHSLLGGNHPSLAQAMGGWEFTLIPIGIATVLVLLGLRVFVRRAPRLAELL